jgi:hypothetical protein
MLASDICICHVNIAPEIDAPSAGVDHVKTRTGGVSSIIIVLPVVAE